MCGVLGYPKGSASELLDGTLKLRHCTDVFTMCFPSWSLPRVGIMGGKRQSVTPGYLLEAGSNGGKTVRLGIPDQGHPTQRRWKRLRPPLPPKEWGVRRAYLAIFFLDLGLGDFAPGDAWNLPSEGTGVGVFPAGQSSRREQCTGTGPF